MRIIVKPGDTLSAVMGGAAATTNPAVMVDRTLMQRHDTSTLMVALNGATAVNLAAPAVTDEPLAVERLSCNNLDTAAVVLTVKLKTGGVTYQLFSLTLQVGDHLIMDDLGLHVIDKSGNVRQSVASASAVTFGGGTATFLGEGNIGAYADGTGLQAALTGADKVVAVYTLPASSLDGVGFRGLLVQASGNFAATANTKQCKIIWNPATAVVGSTVGAGGTVIGDTGASAGNNVGWTLEGQVYKYGALGSNTQVCQELQTVVGTTHGGCGKSTNATAVENAAILIAFTINCTTAVTDATLFTWNVNALN